MTETIKQHFLSPKNLGKLKSPTHVGKAKSGFCGDTVEFMARIDENGKITDIKYNVFGCHVVIATSSILSEWAKGKSIDQIRTVEFPDIANLLGGPVEDGKESCVTTALSALKSLKPT